ARSPNPPESRSTSAGSSTGTSRLEGNAARGNTRRDRKHCLRAADRRSSGGSPPRSPDRDSASALDESREAEKKSGPAAWLSDSRPSNMDSKRPNDAPSALSGQ